MYYAILLALYITKIYVLLNGLFRISGYSIIWIETRFQFGKFRVYLLCPWVG